MEMAIEMLTDVTLSVRGDRILLPPPGVDGGHAGAPGFGRIERIGGDVEHLAPRQSAVRLATGDVLVIGTSGGGGLGPPGERPPEFVAADVRDGRVTAEAAAADYGVVVDGKGDIDAGATADRRRVLNGGRR